MRLAVWGLEWRIAVRRRRLLFFNIGIPLLLVLPVVLSDAPSFHAAAAFTVLFALFGTFGSAIPLLREGDEGSLRRILLTGIPESAYLAERVAASTLLDLLQLLPSLTVIIALGGAHPRAWVHAVVAITIALLAANLLGVWVAATARSIAEGALLGAVVSLFLLHGSGVFRSAQPDTIGAVLQDALPFGPMHQAFLALTSSAGVDISLTRLLYPVAVTVLVLGATIACAGPLLDRIGVPTS